jgi:hypothetical protein
MLLQGRVWPDAAITKPMRAKDWGWNAIGRSGSDEAGLALNPNIAKILLMRRH